MTTGHKMKPYLRQQFVSAELKNVLEYFGFYILANMRIL